jgi:protein phosphatase 2C
LSWHAPDVGDQYARPYVVPDPSATTMLSQAGDEFVITATDGLWDAFTSQEAVDFVHTVSV